MQAMVSGSKDPNVQWRVATEPNEKNFPSSLVSVANSWAAENMFSLFKLQSVLMEMNTGATTTVNGMTGVKRIYLHSRQEKSHWR